MTYNVIRYMALQYKEIEEHKYYVSEKKGHDVGMEYAMRDWYETGQAEKFHIKYFDHMKSIDGICKNMCNNNCGGIEKCVLTKDLVHKILGDDV